VNQITLSLIFVRWARWQVPFA